MRLTLRRSGVSHEKGGAGAAVHNSRCQGLVCRPACAQELECVYVCLPARAYVCMCACLHKCTCMCARVCITQCWTRRSVYVALHLQMVLAVFCADLVGGEHVALQPRPLYILLSVCAKCKHANHIWKHQANICP